MEFDPFNIANQSLEIDEYFHGKVWIDFGSISIPELDIKKYICFNSHYEYPFEDIYYLENGKKTLKIKRIKSKTHKYKYRAIEEYNINIENLRISQIIDQKIRGILD